MKAMEVVTQQTPETPTKPPRAYPAAKGRFGGLGGRGEDNPKSPMLKPKQTEKVDFLQCHKFLCEGVGCFSLGL